MIFDVVLKDLVEIFLVEFFFFGLYPLGSGSGSGSIWTFFGSWIRIRIRIIIDADPQHWLHGAWKGGGATTTIHHQPPPTTCHPPPTSRHLPPITRHPYPHPPSGQGWSDCTVHFRGVATNTIHQFRETRNQNLDKISMISLNFLTKFSWFRETSTNFY